MGNGEGISVNYLNPTQTDFKYPFCGESGALLQWTVLYPGVLNNMASNPKPLNKEIAPQSITLETEQLQTINI
ncbi:hypothetical protein J6590_053827 [Homalodisca vitripennis]|nr:hypothetical protein J6590_053827 [Homalodisca vitripennis]